MNNPNMQEKFMRLIRPCNLLLFLLLAIFSVLALSDESNTNSGSRTTALNFSEKLELLIKSAGQGVVESQAELAHIYYSDYEKYQIDRDLHKAFELYTNAANLGHAESYGFLAYIYAEEFMLFGIEQDYEKAFSLLEVGTQLNDPWSTRKLGEIYETEYENYGVQRDLKKAYKLYKKGVDLGDIDSLGNLAYIYDQDYENFGLKRNPKLAIKYLEMAAEQEDSYSQYYLAYIYDYDFELYGVNRDSKRALELYKKAAIQGDSDAQMAMGYIYYEDYEDYGLEYDELEAMKWYKKASSQGHSIAKNNLALIYLYNDDVPGNRLKGLNLLYESVRMEDDHAIDNFTDYLYKKFYQSNDISLVAVASELYDEGHRPVGVWLARQLLDSNNVFYNPSKALKILSEANKLENLSEHIESQLSLLQAQIYTLGKVVDKDFALATAYFDQITSESIDPVAYGDVLVDYLLTYQDSVNPSKISSFVEFYCSLGATKDYLRDFIGQRFFSISDKIDNSPVLIELCFEKFVSVEVEKKQYLYAAWSYFEGIPGYVLPDYREALNNFQKHLHEDPKSVVAMERIAFLYAEGLGVNKDPKKSKKYYNNASFLDYSYAHNSIGEAQENGLLGFDLSHEDAFKSYQKAFSLDSSNDHSITNLGRFYLNGIFVKENATMGLTYLDLAFKEHENLAAGLELAKYYANNSKMPNNLERARKILKIVLEGNLEYKGQVSPRKYESILSKANNLYEEIIIEFQNQLEPSYGDYYALIIGNSNYSKLPSLKTATNDAERVADVLKANYGFKTELLIDANRSDIMKALVRYRKELSPDDNFLIYYAGHGAIDETGEGYWQPVDAEPEDETEWIPNSSINRTLQKFKSNNLLLISDSCFSGSQLRGVKVSDNPMLPVNVNEKAIIASRYNASMTRVALTSGGLSPVPDSVGFSENSLFAESLINALKSSHEIFFAEDLYKKVRDRVIPMAARSGIDQSPDYGQLFSAGHSDGDFIFQRMALQN